MAEQLWLFRSEGLVIGPVTTEQLLARIDACELDDNTEVQQMGRATAMIPLSKLDYFKVPLARANAKRRVQAQLRAQEAAERMVRRRTIAIVSSLSVVAVILLALFGRYLAVHTSLFGKQVIDDSDIAIEPVEISNSDDAEAIRYNVRPAAPGKPGGTGSSGPLPMVTTTGPDGMTMRQVDTSSLKSEAEKLKPTLGPCFRGVSTGGREVQVPLEFVINNDGSVGKVWIDADEFKTGPVKECLESKLKAAQFPKYNGQKQTVNLKFVLRPKRG